LQRQAQLGTREIQAGAQQGQYLRPTARATKISGEGKDDLHWLTKRREEGAKVLGHGWGSRVGEHVAGCSLPVHRTHCSHMLACSQHIVLSSDGSWSTEDPFVSWPPVKAFLMAGSCMARGQKGQWAPARGLPTQVPAPSDPEVALKVKVLAQLQLFQSTQAVVIKYHRLGLKHQQFVSRSSGGWKFKVKGLAYSVW
jgi:hypothetical protein